MYIRSKDVTFVPKRVWDFVFIFRLVQRRRNTRGQGNDRNLSARSTVVKPLLQLFFGRKKKIDIVPALHLRKPIQGDEF